MRTLLVVLVIWLTIAGTNAIAESQRTLLYEYDEAGNLISVEAVQVEGAPIVENIEPSSLRRGKVQRHTATGSNLDHVAITAETFDLNISNVIFVSDNEVTFDLFTSDAPFGDFAVNFSNLLGSTTQFITVAERLRIISANPNPLILAIGATQTITLRLDEPFTSDKSFQVTVSTSVVLEILSDVFFTLPAGQSEFEVIVRGLALGNAQLTISQIEDSLVNAVQVSVLPPVTLAGPQFVLGRVVGVRLDKVSGSEAVVHTKSVGVTRRSLVKPGETIESTPVGVELLVE